MNKSYRNIFKATSLFGGVQLILIVLSIIRSKAIAVLLGPTGMGINAIMNSSISLISSFTNFGLSSSAVKDLANADSSGDIKKISITIVVLRRLFWITGAIGFFTTLLLSPYLSQLGFDNLNYTLAFSFIAFSILFGQISSGYTVVLQGLRKLKYLALSHVLGASAGLVISIFLYYLFAVKGIMPAIILSSVAGLLINWHFVSKIKTLKTRVEWSETWNVGKGMLKLGLMLSMGGLVSSAASYFLRSFISQRGGLMEVGLYNAGFAIINTYVGMVFTAMSTDYYPRLSSVVYDLDKTKNLVSQQAEISVLVLAPLLSIFILFISFAVISFYSSSFLPVTNFLLWASLGIVFKAYSWAAGFIFISKGASKIFFINEFVSNTYLLVLNMIGYSYYGLTGLGISFLIAYILHLFQVLVVVNKLYGFKYHSDSIRLFVSQILFLGALLAVSLLSTGYWHIVIGGLISLACIFFSFMQLQKRINIFDFIKSNKKLKSRL